MRKNFLSISSRFSVAVIATNFGANMIFVLIANSFLAAIFNDHTSNFSNMPNGNIPVMRFLVISGYILSFAVPTIAALMHAAPVVDEIGSLAESINHMADELKEKEFMKETFGRVVDPAVRDFLMSGNVDLGDETREATVLFCDIRDFTALSERMSASQIVEIVNRYFDRMSACISKEKGLVNKYIGDAIMAIFNAPYELPDHAQAAVRAALRMREELVVLNHEFLREGLPEIKNGIGLHTGPVLAGNIGSSSRMEYTVMGDSVNLASRLESLCKKVSRNIIISEQTHDQIKNNFTAQKLGKVFVKGKLEKITIYTL